MIKKIELWDFESHSHTVIDDISPALNLICGESNTGKTSIIRALKLVAYNDFDQRSVRVGATKCVVRVDTERGYVKVTKGPKDNMWEVQKVGSPVQVFDKVGSSVVPEAADIIGLNIVKLGDVNIPVNIMDQLESHFMLSGVGDKNASGSMRAQIIDEVSGLSGIESLIKNVSLDLYRFGREITSSEKNMNQVKERLHPEEDLNTESEALKSAEVFLDEHDLCDLGYIRTKELLQGSIDLDMSVTECKESVNNIPDIVFADAEISRFTSLNGDAGSAEEYVYQDSRIGLRINDGKGELSLIPDTDIVLDYIRVGHSSHETSVKMLSFLLVYEECILGLKDLNENLSNIGDDVLALKYLSDIDKIMDSIKEMKESHSYWMSVCEGESDRRSLVAKNEFHISEEEDKVSKILSEVTTCPFSLRPVSPECLK